MHDLLLLQEHTQLEISIPLENLRMLYQQLIDTMRQQLVMQQGSVRGRRVTAVQFPPVTGRR